MPIALSTTGPVEPPGMNPPDDPIGFDINETVEKKEKGETV